MQKIFEFIIKHNFRITAITIMISVIVQLKSIIFAPVMYLYDKAPSFASVYDDILSIRNPLHKHKESISAEVIDSILKKYRAKNYSESEISNIKTVLTELIILQQGKDIDSEIDSLIDDISKFDFITSSAFFLSLAKVANKDQAKNLGITALATSFYDKEEAIKYLNQALIIDNKNLFILNNLVKIYLEIGNFDYAEFILNKIIILGNELRKASVVSLGYSNLGAMNLRRKRYPVALKNFKRALYINKKFNLNKALAGNYYNLGITYEYQQDLKTACHNYRKSRVLYYRNYQDDVADRIEKELEDKGCV